MRELKTQVVVIGGGPGGYSAAFRAADLGKQVILVERYENLGGVCLNVGCIPSKALLHISHILDEAKQLRERGVIFDDPQIDIDKIRDWKDSVIKRLNTGLKALVRQRKITLLIGVGSFVSANQIMVQTTAEEVLVTFDNAIIAVGSRPIKLPFVPDDSRVMDSTAALNLPVIPKEMLVIGGGIIGLEMATVYSSLGSKITVVELTEQLIPGMDIDIVKPLERYNSHKITKLMLATKVSKIEAKLDGLWVSFEGKNASVGPQRFDQILVAVGRQPSGKLINAEKIGIEIDEQGFIPVDKQLRTNLPHIFAIGDVVGNPMLAHKAAHEGRVASEFIAGINLNPHPYLKCIPSVAYTDPEVAAVGLSESEAQKQGLAYAKAVFPWIANGRSLSLGRKEGLTKLIFDPVSKKILGGGIVGPNAGELISEIALAVSMQLTAEQIAQVIHPHPTLSETTKLAAEVFLGSVTDLFIH